MSQTNDSESEKSENVEGLDNRSILEREVRRRMKNLRECDNRELSELIHLEDQLQELRHAKESHAQLLQTQTANLVMKQAQTEMTKAIGAAASMLAQLEPLVGPYIEDQRRKLAAPAGPTPAGPPLNASLP